MFKTWFNTNRGVKILSFLTALLIWFHVITERSYEKTIKIPVSCINLKESLFLAKSPPETVETKVRGRGKELLKLGKRLKVEINLRDKGIGWQKIELGGKDIRIPSDSKLEIIEEPFPASFVIRIDKKVKKRVKIAPDLDDIYVFEVIPESVEVLGGARDIYPIHKVLTQKISPLNEFPETLKVALEVPEGVKSSVDSATVILKARL